MFIIAGKRGVLLVFVENAVSNREKFDFASHETGKRIFRRADNGFPAHVETRIDEDRTAGQLVEPRDQGVVARVRLLMNGLDAG